MEVAAIQRPGLPQSNPESELHKPFGKCWEMGIFI